MLVMMIGAVALGADREQWGERFTRNQVSGEKDLPESIDPATRKGIRWSIPLGSETYATPTVAGGRIFVGTNNRQPRDPRHKGDRGILYCLDEKTGQFIWQLVVPKLSTEKNDVYLDWPNAGLCSPPTIEGDRVYAVTNRGEVACLDINGMANGNDGPFVDEATHQTPKGQELVPIGPTDADIIWLTDLVEQAGIYNHDASHCSPLIDGDFIYVNTSNGVDNTHRKIRRPDAPSLVVLDKKTGRIVAKDVEGIGPRIFHCTWSSPALGVVNGKKLIFFGGGDGVVYAFEALNAMPPQGTVLSLKLVWQFNCDTSYPVEKKLEVHAGHSNRRETPSNIKSMPVFFDGRVYVTAGGDIWWGKNQAWLKCIDASRSGDVTSSAEVWSYEMKRTCSTPAIYDGMVFVADCGGRTIHCVDLATGKGLWTHPAKGDMWSSPLVADGRVYIGTRRCEFFILAASREKKVLCATELDAPISATAVAANGVLYMATDSTLYAIAKPQ